MPLCLLFAIPLPASSSLFLCLLGEMEVEVVFVNNFLHAAALFVLFKQ